MMFTSAGRPLTLGREIGRGGEGSILLDSTDQLRVAKVYHTPPDPSRQAKLRLMVSLSDNTLSQFVTWPIDTVHATPGGPIVGFLMPNVTGRVPLHNVYSPTHRKQDHPDLTWQYLVICARNTAHSFDIIHRHRIVVGDVNENSVMVGVDGKVVLIDADSFQVNANGHIHRCVVGVPQYTPPELQAVTSFREVDRAANHDNFGLAVLIFQLLMGGRHPFAGVPNRQDAGNDMSVDISAFRYSDAADAKVRGLTPPRNAVAASVLPAELGRMFQRAFTESGVERRPTANEWVIVLDKLRGSIAVCRKTSTHVYSRHLAICPWCTFDQQGIVHFLAAQVASPGKPTGFVITRFWAEIESVPPPEPIPVPNATSLNLAPRPLPASVRSKVTTPIVVGAILVVAVTLIAWVQSLWPVAVAIFLLTVGWARWYGRPRRGENSARRQAVDAAQVAHQDLLTQIEAVGPSTFWTIRDQLRNLHNEYTVELPARERTALADFDRTSAGRQLGQYLDRCNIDQASIPGLGPTRKATLQSFGVETARDVSASQILTLPGFGPSLANRLEHWKSACTANFRYQPNDPTTKRERTQAITPMQERRRQIEQLLVSGGQELRRASRLDPRRRADLTHQVNETLTNLTQAQADMAII